MRKTGWGLGRRDINFKGARKARLAAERIRNQERLRRRDPALCVDASTAPEGSEA